MKKILFLIFAVIVIAGCSSVKLVNHGLTADPMTVVQGGITTLSWNLEGSSDFSVYITNTTDNAVLFDNLPLKGSKEITLNSTTTFKLNVKNKKGPVKVEGQSKVTVTVK